MDTVIHTTDTLPEMEQDHSSIPHNAPNTNIIYTLQHK